MDNEANSGDFVPNPIYGDEPATYESTVMPDEQEQEPEYNSQPTWLQEDDDNNQQQPQQVAAEQEQEYEQQQESNPPPPYSQDAPAPPAAYSDQYPSANTTQNEPEDVVAQMNQDYQPDEDVGDYGVTAPKISDVDDTDEDGINGEGLFGNYFIRTIYIASSLLFCSMLSFGIWLQKTNGSDFSAGFGLSGFAAFMLFFGSIMSIGLAVMTKLGRPIPFEAILRWTTIGLYATGGIFYFFGGCAVAYAWNAGSSELFKTDSIAGIFFGEQTFIATHGVLAAVDLWKREVLNTKKWRVLAYNVSFFELSLIGFFAYAVTSTRFDDVGVDNAGPAFLALFYFFVMIPCVLFVIVYMIPKLNESLGKPIIYLIFAGSFSLCVVCILIGYFIWVGSDFVSALTGGGAYWVGNAFFITLIGVAIAFDMLFDKFIPGYKDGGSSVSDQQAQNGGTMGAVPTDNPDPDYS